MIILPSTYLPSVEHMAHLLSGEAIIDIGEHYIKRSPRNRARIMSAGGVMDLTVNIQKANTPRQAMSGIKIDYSKRWQHQHRMAIVSAYRSSPYFEHYWPYLEPLFSCEFELLHELNDAILRVLITLMGGQEELIRYSDSYITPQEGDIDLRPKSRELTIHPEEYTQIFYDRFDFAPNLSSLDLLLCEGTNAARLLEAMRL
ncbi:MAG: WbqC family protein [Rikenellaceae bacterium]